jgi:hypothetical protein
MSGPSYSFTAPGGEEVRVGWDPDTATFWAQVHHPTMPAHLAEQGIDPREYNPQDHPEVLVGARPFDALHSDILAVRVRKAGYRIPPQIREDLAAYDDPARTLDNTVRQVTETAAWRLDRPGVPPQAHAEEQRMLHEAAREAAKDRYVVWGDPDAPDLTPEEVARFKQMLTDSLERRRLEKELGRYWEKLESEKPENQAAQMHDEYLDGYRDYYDRDGIPWPEIPPDEEAGPEYGDEGPEPI